MKTLEMKEVPGLKGCQNCALTQAICGKTTCNNVYAIVKPGERIGESTLFFNEQGDVVEELPHDNEFSHLRSRGFNHDGETDTHHVFSKDKISVQLAKSFKFEALILIADIECCNIRSQQKAKLIFNLL